MENLKYFLFFSAILSFGFVFYSWLVKYLRRNDINIKFAYLFPFSEPYFSNKNHIKIDVAIYGLVRAEVITSQGEVVAVAFEEHLTPGIHTKEVDFTPVANGNYVLRIVFPDQTITRFITIRHEG